MVYDGAERGGYVNMEQNQTLLDQQNETTQTEPPSASEPIEQKVSTKQKKKLTREQR